MIYAFCILFLQSRMKDIQYTKQIEGIVNKLLIEIYEAIIYKGAICRFGRRRARN